MRESAALHDEASSLRARRARALGLAVGIAMAVFALVAWFAIESRSAPMPVPRASTPPLASESPPARARASGPAAPAAAGQANALPTGSPSRRDAAHAAAWSTWLAAANAGDAVAACRLSALLDDCRLAGEVEHMIDTQVSIAASNDASASLAAHEIAELDASLEPLRSRCSELPGALHAQNWNHLLQAAIAGHEPSMLRFLLDPPLERLAGIEYDAATRAYRENAALFLAALLQRASSDALAIAYRVAQGEEFVPGIAIRARDPEAAVRYGTALLALREDDPATLIGVESALAQLAAPLASRAQSEGQRLVPTFLPRFDADAPAASVEDECRRGWPGEPASRP